MAPRPIGVDGAVANHHRPVLVEDAAAVAGPRTELRATRVAGDCAVGDSHRPVLVGDAATREHAFVGGDRAVADLQRPGVGDGATITSRKGLEEASPVAVDI